MDPGTRLDAGGAAPRAGFRLSGRSQRNHRWAARGESIGEEERSWGPFAAGAGTSGSREALHPPKGTGRNARACSSSSGSRCLTKPGGRPYPTSPARFSWQTQNSQEGWLLGIHQREGLGQRHETGRAAPGWRLSLLLFGLALAPRLLVFGMNTQPREARFKEPDSGSYIQAAESLRNRSGFLHPKGSVTWPRLPGYPLLLAACFEAGLASPENLAGAVLIQVVLGSLVVVLSSRVAF